MVGFAIALDALTPLSVGAIFGINIGASAVVAGGLFAEAKATFVKAMEVFKETYGDAANKEFAKLSKDVVLTYASQHKTQKINYSFVGDSQKYLHPSYGEVYEYEKDEDAYLPEQKDASSEDEIEL